MSCLENTNARISQKYAARAASEARAILLRLINGHRHELDVPHLEYAAASMQYRSSIYYQQARYFLTAPASKPTLLDVDDVYREYRETE